MAIVTLAKNDDGDACTHQDLVAGRNIDSVDLEAGTARALALAQGANPDVENPSLEKEVAMKELVEPWSARSVQALRNYLLKWKGVPGKYSPPRASYHHMLWSFIGAFVGICMLAVLNFNTPGIEDTDLVMLIGSFGATAVLAYAEPLAPLSQPRNIVGGHVVAAVVGVSVRLLWEAILTENEKWLACGLAVALAINAMQLTKTVHPPGGATALIAVTGSAAIRSLGYWYVLMPAGSGALLMLVWALVVNNLSSAHSYPVWWI